MQFGRLAKFISPSLSALAEHCNALFVFGREGDSNTYDDKLHAQCFSPREICPNDPFPRSLSSRSSCACYGHVPPTLEKAKYPGSLDGLMARRGGTTLILISEIVIATRGVHFSSLSLLGFAMLIYRWRREMIHRASSSPFIFPLNFSPGPAVARGRERELPWGQPFPRLILPLHFCGTLSNLVQCLLPPDLDNKPVILFFGI